MTLIYIVIYLLDNRLLCWNLKHFCVVSQFTVHTQFLIAVYKSVISVRIPTVVNMKNKKLVMYLTFTKCFQSRHLHRQVLSSMEVKQKSFGMKANLQKVINNPLHLCKMHVFSSIAQLLGHLITFLRSVKI